MTDVFPQLIPNQQGSATSDATGKVSITIPTYVAPGLAYKGNVTMAGGSASTLWNVGLTDGQSFGSSYGPAPVPCIVTERTQLVITSTNAPPNTLITASFAGLCDYIDNLNIGDPNPTLTGISTTRPAVLLDHYSMLGGGGGSTVTKTYTMDPNARAVSICLVRTSGPTAPFSLISVTGGTTGYVYLSGGPISQTNTKPAYNLISFNAAIDPTLIIGITIIAGGGGNVFIAEEFDPLLIGVESIADGADINTVKQTYTGIGGGGILSTTNVSTSVGTTSTSLFAGFAPFYFWFISNPLTNTSDIWLAYDHAAVVGAGIWLPPGAVLYEDLFMGPVTGIVNGAGAESVGITYA